MGSVLDILAAQEKTTRPNQLKPTEFTLSGAETWLENATEIQ